MLISKEYKQVLETIKKQIQQAQYQSLRIVNKQMIDMYRNIWKTLFEKVSTWRGKSIIENLAKDIQQEYPSIKWFSERNLRLMKQFYETYKENEKLQQLVAEIPWGQNLLIISKIKNDDEREYYITKCKENGRSRGVLEEEIKHKSYIKTLSFQNNFKKTISKDKLSNYRLNFKDEYNLSFLWLKEEHDEKELEDGITKNIIKTIWQLWSDFCFMWRQVKLEVSGNEYFIDLLFYHRKLKSLIAIELKINDFKPEYSQQLNRYLHLLDKQMKYSEDNPSIGILICKSKNKILVEYALELANNPMWIATYTYSKLPKNIAKYLPNELKLQKLL